MNIGLSGKGKLGKAIIDLAPRFGVNILWTKGSQETWDEIWDKYLTPDVAIEVSTPETAYENCHFLLTKGVPVVCGTTGWHDKRPALEAYCREIAGSFLYASNFSLGVNILFELNRKLAELVSVFEQFETSISEKHHITKKDAPSGTAITLADAWIENNKVIDEWSLAFPTAGIENLNVNKGKLPIICERITDDDIYGIHEIEVNTSNDHIFIGHKALNRKGFAEGAIMASQWLKNRKGVFSMRDLLLEKGI